MCFLLTSFPSKNEGFSLFSSGLLTLSHFPFFAAFNGFAFVVPGDGWIRQARHFALQNRFLPFDHLHITQRFDEVRHGPSLHLTFQHFWLFGDRRHLLQFRPKAQISPKLYSFKRNVIKVSGVILKLIFASHVRRDGSSGFLHVELSSTFSFSMNVLSNRRVEALRVTTDVADDQRMAAGLL